MKTAFRAGFGLNWTDPCSEVGPLFRVVMNNKYGTPDILFYGGGGNGYADLDWEGYKMTDTISPYYIYMDAYYGQPHGSVTVWERDS